MESQGLNVLEGITGSFQYLTSTNDVNFVNGTFTGNITGSKINVTSSTAQEFILDNNSVGTPFVYSPTNLNLSASNAVVVTSSPFRLKSLTNSQTSSYTPQDGDLIFNSDRAAYMAYSGSDWQEIIISGFTASYASQALSSSYAISSSTSNNTFAFGLSTTSSISSPQDGDIIFDTTGSGSFAKKYLAYSGSEWHSFILDSDTITSASYAITSLSASYADYAITVSGSIETASLAYTASYVEASNIDGIVTSASYATTASYALNIPSNTGFPYTGSAEITGSLTVTGSILTDSTIEATASYAISSSISTNSVNGNTNSGSISWWSGTQAEFNIISSSAELGKIYFVI